MGFIENMEKGIVAMLIFGMLLAIALMLAGAGIGLLFAITMGLDLLETIKIGLITGMLVGMSLGMLLVLAHTIKESVKEK